MLQWLALFFVVAVTGPSLTRAQTPSPLPEWQYSAGIPLQELFEPTRPEWRVVLGAAAAVEPVYSGARAYRVQGGPVINIRYKDLAFLSRRPLEQRSQEVRQSARMSGIQVDLSAHSGAQWRHALVARVDAEIRRQLAKMLQAPQASQSGCLGLHANCR